MGQVDASTTFSELKYIEAALTDAENLLKFASENGVVINDDTRNHVLCARAAFGAALDEPTAANLLIALARLAGTVSPVTAESLRESANPDARPHPYRIWAMILAVIIVVYSTLSFVTSSIAASIRNDITTANALAVKLTAAFGTTADQTAIKSGAVASAPDSDHPPLTSKDKAPALATTLPSGLNKADVISDLQLYAATIRNIDTHARQLSFLTNLYKNLKNPESIDPFSSIRNDPVKLHDEFELRFPLEDYRQNVVKRTETYQKVRYLAQSVADDVSFYYGAVSSCILPVLYALLGAAAYLLRTFERQWSARTYVPSAADSARFLVAAIGGAVLGLFSNLTGSQGVTVPPLALAFLVGYSVDVFFTFLESLIQSFTKSALISSPAKPTTTSSSAKTPAPTATVA